MLLLLATVLAVHCYKKHEATKAHLGSTTTNLDPALDSKDCEKGIAYLEHQANEPYVYCATQGLYTRQSRDCATCSRVNASRCHQRKCYRRQDGGSWRCVGRRRARQLAVPKGIEVVTAPKRVVGGTASAQEHDITDYDIKGRDSGYCADSKFIRGSRANEKEVEAGYADGYESQVEKYVELPPYKG